MSVERTSGRGAGRRGGSGRGLRGSGPRVGLAGWVWAGPFGLNPGPIFALFFGKNAIFFYFFDSF